MGDIDFKRISATENSNNVFLKTRFWNEKSVEDVVTLGPTAQASLVLIITPCLHTFLDTDMVQKD